MTPPKEMNMELFDAVKDLIYAMEDIKYMLAKTAADNCKVARKARVALIDLEKKAKNFRKLSVQHFRELKR